MVRRKFGQVERRPSTIPGKPVRYRARYVGPDGELHRAVGTFPTLGAAEAWLDTNLRKITLGIWDPDDDDPAADPAARYTLGAYAEAVIAARENRPIHPLKASTAHLYRTLVDSELQPLRDKYLRTITERHVRDWHRASSAHKHPTQTANAYNLLRSVMSEAVTERLVESNPCTVRGAAGKPAPVHRAEALSMPELRAYYDALDEDHRLPLMLAALCGLRSGEVRALRLKDVNPVTGAITVRQGIYRVAGKSIISDPKTAAGIRTVYAPASLRPDLANATKGRSAEELLFVARDGHSPLHDSFLRKAHLKARAAINRPTLRIHDLRKTAATLAAQQGATVRELMEMLGHTTPTVAMIYQAAGAERMQAIANRLDDQWGQVSPPAAPDQEPSTP